MVCSTPPDDDYSPLVVDTSVLINVCSSGYGEAILRALPTGIVVPRMVADEMRREGDLPLQGSRDFLNHLARDGVIEVVRLSDAEYVIFEQLTMGVDTLGDGEAAAIAVAAARNLRPIIDERKGRQRAATFIPSDRLGWSVDLLRHPQVVKILGDTQASEALYKALRVGRMRIPAERANEVIELIGETRARECTCLPDYKKLFAGRA